MASRDGANINLIAKIKMPHYKSPEDFFEKEIAPVFRNAGVAPSRVMTVRQLGYSLHELLFLIQDEFSEMMGTFTTKRTYPSTIDADDDFGTWSRPHSFAFESLDKPPSADFGAMHGDNKTWYFSEMFSDAKYYPEKLWSALVRDGFLEDADDNEDPLFRAGFERMRKEKRLIWNMATIRTGIKPLKGSITVSPQYGELGGRVKTGMDEIDMQQAADRATMILLASRAIKAVEWLNSDGSEDVALHKAQQIVEETFKSDCEASIACFRDCCATVHDEVSEKVYWQGIPTEDNARRQQCSKYSRKN